MPCGAGLRGAQCASAWFLHPRYLYHEPGIASTRLLKSSPVPKSQISKSAPLCYLSCRRGTRNGSQGEVPALCTPEIMHTVLQQHLESPAMWTIFPIQARRTHAMLWCQCCAPESMINLSLPKRDILCDATPPRTSLIIEQYTMVSREYCSVGSLQMNIAFVGQYGAHTICMAAMDDALACPTTTCTQGSVSIKGAAPFNNSERSTEHQYSKVVCKNLSRYVHQSS